MMKCYLRGVVVTLLCVPGLLYANTLNVPIDLIKNNGAKKSIGQIVVSETEYGLLFTPQLKGLPVGIHGFHVHENPSCESTKNEKDGSLMPAQAAGGHFDPQKTAKHLGPYDKTGHLGDLPAIYVTKNGVADYPVLAPKLTSLDQIAGRALMIHAGGDNHSDKPASLGGGGVRLACGVIR